MNVVKMFKVFLQNPQTVQVWCIVTANMSKVILKIYAVCKTDRMITYLLIFMKDSRPKRT